MFVADPIHAAQRELGLVGRDALFATLLDVEASTLRAAMEGDGDARDTVVRAAAEALGIEPDELLFEGAEGRATTALLKTVVDPRYASAFEEAAHQGLHRELGRFVRRLRRKAWLRAVLGDESPTLPPTIERLVRPTLPEASAPFGADALATKVRERLDLYDQPIESMVSLVLDRLHIELHVSRSMWEAIDGASYACGAVRGILVNVRERPRSRSIRMTLAHELCHVLFDGAFADARDNGMLLFSPGEDRARRPRRGGELANPAEAFYLREKRANAFAAYLLAPPQGVKALFPGREPPMVRETIDRVAEHFGLSRLTALNVVTNVYHWSKDDRLWVLETLTDATPLDDARWDADALTNVPTVDDEHRALADRAVGEGRMLSTERDRHVGE